MSDTSASEPHSFFKMMFEVFSSAVMPVKHATLGEWGWDAPVGNLAVCSVGNRRHKQMEHERGFTASQSVLVVGQSLLPGIVQPDPGGADRRPYQSPMGAN